MTQPSSSHGGHQSFWLWVMCLTGVDYFSTLGYQPSIAFDNTGMLAPLATVVLVVVTLLGALPVYCYVAGRSPHGQGSIGMMEHLMHGWLGKALVLTLLGFAATDFVITKTLSAADAAEHLIHNPFWPFAERFGEHHGGESVASATGGVPDFDEEEPHRRENEETHQRMLVTLLLLLLLGAMFMKGFKEVIGLAVVIVGVYLMLNVLILGSGLLYLARHQDLLHLWWSRVQSGEWFLADRPLSGAGTGPWAIAGVCLLLFPKLALGLSGFETGVAVMPLVKGPLEDDPLQPSGRIRNTRKLLLTAAMIMSVMLLGSALITTTLIDPKALGRKELLHPDTGLVVKVVKGPAVDRALAFIAHGEGGTGKINPWLFGNTFGTLYDLSTVVILWFAGASAMAGLLNLVPQYSPRYGMAPEWTKAFRPLVFLFTGINLFVTWVFDASVSAQGDAYATGVLVLMSSACMATVIERWRSRKRIWLFRVPWYFCLVTAVFLYTTGSILWRKPVGLQIALCFIVFIIVSSIISRTIRSTELRFGGFQFKDEQSRFLWESMRFLEFPVLVPHRPGKRSLANKEEIIREEHRLTPEIPIVFLEVELGDASDFYQEPLVEVKQDEGRFILRITRAASIAHTIAALGLEFSKVGKPPEIHFGWTDESPVAGMIGFLLFGEGNVPWMVHELLEKAEPDPERRPAVVVGGR